MWTLKSKSTKRWTQEELENFNKANPRNQMPAGRALQLELSMTFSDGKQDITVSTFISSEDEVKKTITQNLARLNEQAALEAKIADDTFDPEAEEVVEKTPEEIAAEEAAAAKAEWQKRRSALKQMREDMMEAKDIGVEPTTEQVTTMKALAEWVRDNASEEYYS